MFGRDVSVTEIMRFCQYFWFRRQIVIAFLGLGHLKIVEYYEKYSLQLNLNVIFHMFDVHFKKVK